MHIVKSINSTHTIKFIPREYTLLDMVLTITNEANDTDYVLANSFITIDGIMSLTFDFDFTNKQRFSLFIEDAKENIIYRGKILCLDDNTQDVKQTTQYYTYGG